ncbi:glycosyltransferase family 4 protein [Clostridium perfringens]|uniref:glycosyltransferase family 4 protein n=1 Tax=Clostridium perfringens TaxID=1502 RepID=UPI001F0665D6|nr:glycosyltransferase family 4 protein [Clostridium perfringens]
MKIAFLSYLSGFGGAEKQNILLANEMVARGHEVILISICDNNMCYDLDSRVKYIFLPDKNKGVFRFLSRFIDIKATLEDIKPDITVNFWFQSAYLTAIMKKSITGKIIYSERGDPGDKEYSGVLGIVRKIIFPRIDGFVFQSEGAKQFFDKQIQEKSIIIHNPVFINRNEYPIISERSKRIVTMGRLHKQKNQKLLIDAFSRIADEFFDYSLEIYGDGELKSELQRQIQSYNLEKRIFLKGARKDIHSSIYDASLFILSSDYEGLPNALIEAMALGIPCISTDCKPGGAREIINDNEDGLIVKINDAEALSYAIKYVLENSDFADKLSKNALKNISRFNSKVIYNNWSDYMKKILEVNNEKK